MHPTYFVWLVKIRDKAVTKDTQQTLLVVLKFVH